MSPPAVAAGRHAFGAAGILEPILRAAGHAAGIVRPILRAAGRAAGIVRPILSAAVLPLLTLPASADRVETADEIAARAAGAGIVLLGEIHDNPAHHALQAEVIALLAPSALVFEMLSPEDAARITPELAADPAALASALDWAASGWPDFGMYYPLLAYGGSIPVHGAEVPRGEAQDAFARGAAGIFGADAERFGLTDPLPEAEQTAREAGQLAAHCDALPPEILPGFVEAQRLRDAMLARAALDALETHGPPVAVVTGNGHARRDWGVPALLARAAPGTGIFALGQFEAAPEAPVPFDAWTIAAPVDREDPCAAFR
jgi:uncharacterized iron-regulated protein